MRLLADKRRRNMILLAAGSLLVFVLLGTLQWFNTSGVDFLTPETYGQTLLFTALEGLLFLLLLFLLVLLFRNLFRVYVGEGSNALGARLRSRLVLGAVMIALTPAALMFLFSYLLMNRSLERWFSPSIAQLRDDTSRVVRGLAQYVIENARVEAESIAATGAPDRDLPQLDAELRSHRITLAGGFAVVYDQNRRVLASFQAPAAESPAFTRPWVEDEEHAAALPRRPLNDMLLAAAQHADEQSLNVAGQRFALGMSATASGKVVVVALPMPQGLSRAAANINNGTAEYWQMFRSRNRIRTIFVLFLLLLTVFDFFFSVWLALFLSKQITRPVEALADAMNEIAKGGYQRRVAAVATGEMGDLVRSFNHMAADLEASRQLAESAQAQLTAANQAIEERRRELETIVETIPSGVVTFNSAGIVLQANHAFAALMGLKENAALAGQSIESLLPAECAADLAETIRRGHRMGAASTEVEFLARGRTVHLAITSARLELGHGQAGSVLVVEDTTDLLRAQRQMAWKEVAQQVAHEIKNPLTPIALSAERIGKHLDRGQADSPNVIRKCSEVILGCVGTLRRLVDQFSALAQFPAPQPRLCAINQIVEEALAMFGGRLEGITVQRNLELELPQVLVDHEAIRRALANLIDNAAEAMQGSLLRLLGVRTALSEDGSAVEVIVSDTGTGITDEIRERLFLPFYSTKHRGTGLGLSIAAKIAQEHGGSISAEANSPKGARFIVRLPLMEPAAQSIAAVAGGENLKGLAS
jgi:hypothetical protein